MKLNTLLSDLLLSFVLTIMTFSFLIAVLFRSKYSILDLQIAFFYPIGAHYFTSILVAGFLFLSLFFSLKLYSVFPILLYNSLYEQVPTLAQIHHTGLQYWLDYVSTNTGFINEMTMLGELGILLVSIKMRWLQFKHWELIACFIPSYFFLTWFSLIPSRLLIQIPLACIVYLSVQKEKQ